MNAYDDPDLPVGLAEQLTGALMDAATMAHSTWTPPDTMMDLARASYRVGLIAWTDTGMDASQGAVDWLLSHGVSEHVALTSLEALYRRIIASAFLFGSVDVQGYLLGIVGIARAHVAQGTRT